MSIEIVLTIIGAFGTIALSINAFFLRGIYSKQQDIEIKVTKLIVREEAKEKRLEDLEEENKLIRERLYKLSNKVQYLDDVNNIKKEG